MNECFLVATVGGAPEPLVASLLHWRPLKVIFVVSRETRRFVDKIVALVQDSGYPGFDAGRYEISEIPNAQDYTGVFNHLRALDVKIQDLKKQHPSVSVIADLTGGTKVMGAALALIAGHWDSCRISYVGGEVRTKDGVGIVVTGSEHIVHTQHPWDALGILAVDQAQLLLDRHAFAAAEQLMESTLRRVEESGRKAELAAMKTLASVLTNWDRFRYRDAKNLIKDLRKHGNHFNAILGHETGSRIISNLERLHEHCARILGNVQDVPPSLSRELILDLIANAKRRIEEYRWDDATARLYRAVEAIAQLKLKSYGYDTGAVSVDRLPIGVQDFAAKAINGVVKIGLQEAWRLLAELADPTALVFSEKFPDPRKSLLTVRNNSLLAHGFAPVSENVAKDLLDVVMRLLEASADELPAFQWFMKSHAI